MNRFSGVEAYVDAFDTQANAVAALEHIKDDPQHCLLFPDSNDETEFLGYQDVRPDNGELVEYQCGKRKGMFSGAVVPMGIPVIISVRVTKDVPDNDDAPENTIDQLFSAIQLREVGDKMAKEARSIQSILRELGL